MEENNQDNDNIYVYLDFGDQIQPKTFDQQIFLRVANLHKSNPLVQLNEHVFKGQYEDCVGTNLFFEEIENPPFRAHAFEKDTPIRLNFLTKQTKVIRLKEMKVPQSINKLTANEEPLQTNFKQDYNTVLQKIADGTLSLDDMVKKPEKSEQIPKENLMENIEIEKDSKNPTNSSNNSKNPELSSVQIKFEKLKKLARKPVRRCKSLEKNSGSDPKYRKNYEFDNLKCLVLRENFIDDDVVDIEKSALFKLIKPSNNPKRQLTQEEFNKIVTLENFQNLSLKSRYIILKECLKNLTYEDEGRELIEKLVKAFEQRLSVKEGEIVNEIPMETDKEKEIYMKLYPENVEDLVGDIEEIYNKNEWENGEKVKESDFRENWESDKSDSEKTD